MNCPKSAPRRGCHEVKRTPLLLLLASLCVFVIPVKGASAPSAKPNIVFLLADNLGGVRVPWIVRWPGHVPAGRTDEQSVISGADWLPTLCAIASVKINANDCDGEDASAAWFGKAPHVRTKPQLWKTSSPGSESFIRQGQWKLRHPTRKKDGELELYDITAGPAESKNLAAQHPEIVKKLSVKVEAWVDKLPKEYLTTSDKLD